MQTNKYRLSGRDLIFFTALIIAFVKLIWHVSDVLDLIVVDEPSYLTNGVNHLWVKEYAPLYSLWYGVLHLFQQDNIRLMMLNDVVLCGLFSVAFYFYLRRMHMDAFFAFTLSFLMLICEFNLPISPKVVVFMNILQMLIFGAAASSIRKDFRMSMVLVLLFMAYYIRPEYKLSFELMFVVSGIYTVYKVIKGDSVKRLVPYTAMALMAVFIAIFLGNPFVNDGREILAFGQHFSFNYVKWHHLDINPFTNWKFILYRNFGKVDTPFQALLANPSLVFQHVAENIRDYLWILIHKVIPAFFPWNVCVQWYQKIILVGSYLFLLAYIIRNFSLRRNKSEIIVAIRKNAYLLLVWCVLVIPQLIAVFIIAPRYHYIALQLPTFITFLMIAFNIFFVKKYPDNNPYLIPAAILSLGFILITPFPKQNPFVNRFSDKPFLRAIETINKNGLHQPVHSLNFELLPFSKYEGTNYHDYEKEIPFDQFLQQKKLNLILVNGDINTDERYVQDWSWKHFLQSYDSLGFDRVEVQPLGYCLIKKY